MIAETMLAFKFLLLLLSLFLPFFFRLFILQLHFWLCFLSWLLLSIFVYMYYMPFMCLFLECLFGFIFMISCIFKRLKVDFISVCLLASLSRCVSLALARCLAYELVNDAIDNSLIQMFLDDFDV